MPFNLKKSLTRKNFHELPPLCTDGAWGTELQKLGAKPGELYEVWNIEQPEKVFAVAKAYVDAGAQIILTNTFSGNRFVLERHKAAHRLAEFNQAGADISKRAAAGKAYVFASMGPTGKMVMMGEIATDVVEEAFARQAEALAAGGADALVIETQADLAEAQAALRGCVRACALPVGVTFSFDSGPDRSATMMGVRPEQAYQMAKENGASFVGANCGVGIDAYVRVAELFAKCGKDLPLWIKGNAGKPEVQNGKSVYRGTPEMFANAVKPLRDAGVRFIGGCCGSTPAHIRAVAKALKEKKQ